MRKILQFLMLLFALSACGLDNESVIRFSGQVSGEYEVDGSIMCNDRNKVPFLSFLASEEDNYDLFTIYLVPGITTGNYQFTNENIEGADIRFMGFIHEENVPLLRPEDLVSGELTLTQLPDMDGGWVEGEFDVVYPDMTVEGTFKFRADPEDAPFDCVN